MSSFEFLSVFINSNELMKKYYTYMTILGSLFLNSLSSYCEYNIKTVN